MEVLDKPKQPEIELLRLQKKEEKEFSLSIYLLGLSEN